MIKNIKNISGGQLDWDLGLTHNNGETIKVPIYKEEHFAKLCEFGTLNQIEVRDNDDKLIEFSEYLRIGNELIKKAKSKYGTTDITTIQAAYVCTDLYTDFLQSRAEIINSFRWANSHTNEEKDIVIDTFSFDPTISASDNDTNKVGYLMTTKGMSQAEAQSYLLDVFVDYHLKEKESHSKRRNSKKLTKVVAKYLSFLDSRDFIETTKTLLDLYTNDGIVGVNHGIVGEGIIDYIDSTVGTSYENVGLAAKGYVFNDPSMSIEGFRTELKDILINGIY